MECSYELDVEADFVGDEPVDVGLTPRWGDDCGEARVSWDEPFEAGIIGGGEIAVSGTALVGARGNFIFGPAAR